MLGLHCCSWPLPIVVTKSYSSLQSTVFSLLWLLLWQSTDSRCAGFSSCSWGLGCCYSVTKLCLTLCDPRDCSMPGFPVLHCPLEFVHTHAHWIDDAIQTSHPLTPPSPYAFSLSRHQCLFPWIDSHKGLFYGCRTCDTVFSVIRFFPCCIPEVWDLEGSVLDNQGIIK